MAITNTIASVDNITSIIKKSMKNTSPGFFSKRKRAGKMAKNTGASSAWIKFLGVIIFLFRPSEEACQFVKSTENILPEKKRSTHQASNK
jgi:hypothetical protein